jgi:hypothetical protein
MKAIQSNELRFNKQDWSKVSQPAKDLITRMLDRSQATRIKAAEILEDKWFTSRDKQNQQEMAEASEAAAEAEKVNSTTVSDNAENLDQNKSCVRFEEEEEEENKQALSQREKPVLPKYKSKSNYKQSTMMTPRFEEEEE